MFLVNIYSPLQILIFRIAGLTPIAAFLADVQQALRSQISRRQFQYYMTAQMIGLRQEISGIILILQLNFMNMQLRLMSL